MQTTVVGECHTFGEYLLLPGMTRKACGPETVRLDCRVTRHPEGAEPALRIGIPLASAMMQSVTDHILATALARRGGIGFLYASQSVEDQAEMVRAVKNADPCDRGLDRLPVGAAVNTKDYRERIPALVDAGVDVMCVDSSNGYSEWSSDVLTYVRSTFGDAVKIGAGNVVTAEGFRYLAEAGADFVKVGMGGGAVSVSREHKGLGCGQATSVLDVGAERDRFAAETGEYVPICSDGGITQDHHIAIALALGADFVMMGRYFARFEESPGKVIRFNLSYAKEYWGEGTSRANRRSAHDVRELEFEEGVDAYVPFAGSLADNVNATMAKLRSVLSSCGACDLDALRSQARLVRVSALSLREGSAHDVILKRTDTTG